MNSIEKGQVPVGGTYWGFVPSCGGNPQCWFGMPSVGKNQTSYTDTFITAGVRYSWRIKHDTTVRSNTVAFTIDSCSCGGGCPPDAQYVSKTHPVAVARGASFAIVFTMRNTGSNAWTGADTLVATDAANAATWGLSLTNAAGSGTPGSSVTYTVSGTAPSTPGSYAVQPWRMSTSGTPFGESTPTFNITVISDPPAGSVDSLACADGIRGTATDPDHPGQAVTYRVYVDGDSSCAGCLQLPVQNTAPTGEFTWAIPQSLRDAASHAYHVYAQDIDSPSVMTALNPGGSPLTCFTAPVVTLAKSSTGALPYNSADTLSWSVTNSTGSSCAFTGGNTAWQAQASDAYANPSYDTGPLAATTTFTLTCTNPGGSHAQSVTVNVLPAPSPEVLTLSASTDAADYCQYGASIRTNWTSTAKPQSAYQLQVATDSGFTNIIYDSGQVGHYVAIRDAQPWWKRVGTWLKDAFVIHDANARVWAQDDSSCGGGNNDCTPAGNGPIDCFRDSDCFDNSCGGYTGWCINRQCACGNTPSICNDRCADRGLICNTGSCRTQHVSDCRGIATGGNGGVISYCAVNNAPPPPPPPPPPPAVSVTLSASPASVPYGGSSVVTWTSSNATSCTRTNGITGWPGSPALSGTFTTGSLGVSKQFDIVCTGAGAPGSRSVTVNVAPPSPTDITADSAFAQPLAPAYNATVYVRVKVWRDADGSGDLSAGDIESAWSSTATTTTLAQFPEPSISFDPDPPIALASASFNDAGDCHDATCSRQWDFGDGSGLVVGSPTIHTYAAASDSVSVTLTATNSAGSCQDTALISIGKAIPKFIEVAPQ